MSIAELVKLGEEFDSLIPVDDKEQEKRLDEIDAKLMRGALAERFMVKEEIQKVLAEATALFGYFSSKYSKWSTIEENLENTKYLDVKKFWTDGKFVSAVAEREGKAAANSARVLASFFESCRERALEVINTCKKLLGKEDEERRNG